MSDYNENEYLRKLFIELDAEMNRDAEKSVQELQKPEYMDLRKYIQGFNDKKGFKFNGIPMDKKKLMYSIVSPDKHSGSSYVCLWRKIQEKIE